MSVLVELKSQLQASPPYGAHASAGQLRQIIGVRCGLTRFLTN